MHIISEKATECPEVPTVQSPLCEVLYTRTTTILDKVDTGEDESEEEDERKDDDDQEAGEEYDDPGREEEEGNGATGLHSDECPTSNKSEVKKSTYSLCNNSILEIIINNTQFSDHKSCVLQSKSA